MLTSDLERHIFDSVNYLFEGVAPVSTTQVEAVRSFNRFWTRRIGVLDSGLLETPYSLTEARVLFELAQGKGTEVQTLRRDLGLDAGYLSRILSRFASEGLVDISRSESDGRRRLARLTGEGQRVFAGLNRRTVDQIGDLLSPLGVKEVARLTAALQEVQSLFDPLDPAGPETSEHFMLGEPGPGDLGWVVQRHGVLYTNEYGWDETFEALVARIVGEFAESRDPARERAWIARHRGDPCGSVFCVAEDDVTAKLRLLLVEPEARGQGIGAALVTECIDFARSAGYERMVLWTNDVLVSARKIYEASGFRLVASEPHHSFGVDLVGQDWELDLTP